MNHFQIKISLKINIFESNIWIELKFSILQGDPFGKTQNKIAIKFTMSDIELFFGESIM